MHREYPLSNDPCTIERFTAAEGDTRSVIGRVRNSLWIFMYSCRGVQRDMSGDRTDTFSRRLYSQTRYCESPTVFRPKGLVPIRFVPIHIQADTLCLCT